MTEYIRFKLRM